MKSMTKAQQKFLMVTLPAFIVREQGRGFAMSGWLWKPDKSQNFSGDGILRTVPSCGTVACIGGSAELLLDVHEGNTHKLRMKMGLSKTEAAALFLRWFDYAGWAGDCWPAEFSKRYAAAKTPIDKAKIAASLCRLVGKTKGACLRNNGRAR